MRQLKQNLESLLRGKYSIILGEKSLSDVANKISKLSGEEIKISGRSSETGRKKTIRVSLAKLSR